MAPATHLAPILAPLTLAVGHARDATRAALLARKRTPPDLLRALTALADELSAAVTAALGTPAPQPTDAQVAAARALVVLPPPPAAAPAARRATNAAPKASRPGPAPVRSATAKRGGPAAPRAVDLPPGLVATGPAVPTRVVLGAGLAASERTTYEPGFLKDRCIGHREDKSPIMEPDPLSALARPDAIVCTRWGGKPVTFKLSLAGIERDSGVGLKALRAITGRK